MGDTPLYSVSPFASYERRVSSTRLPFPRYEMRVVRVHLPFSSSETEQLPDSVVSIRNSQIFTHWAYFTKISNEIQISTQMTIFSHIEHISHKYPMKVKFPHKLPYFHTLSIFYTNILYKSYFHTNGHIFTHWAYFTQSFLWLSIAVLVFWNSWLFHGGHCASTELWWPMVFLAWSSRWQKEESHQIDQTLPQWRHSQLQRFIVF
jgi:hypothetical protein